MNRFALLVLFVSLASGCGRPEAGEQTSSTPAVAAVPTSAAAPAAKLLTTRAEEKAEPKVSLVEARRCFKTKLVRKLRTGEPVPPPPPDLFRLVRYESPAGKLAAYLSVSPQDGKKHPAIIWIIGGFSNSIGSNPWSDYPVANDQSGSAFRKAGIVMMYPSFRGGNDNPGFKESFFGEVDDVLAAADFLAKQDFVDPQRIYLAGHSTGGTMALLAAECTDRFRGVFSIGPVADVTGYDKKYLLFDVSDEREAELRAPERWLDSIRCPVFAFEGTKSPANVDALRAMSRECKNPLVRFYEVKGADHFTILAPLTQLIAGKIVRDTGPTAHFLFPMDVLEKPFAR